MNSTTKTSIVASVLGASVALVLVFAGAMSAQAATYSFSTNLRLGSNSADVANLQRVLNSSADTMVSASGAGAPGSETTYFGAKTRAAVIKFQIKNSIVPAVGFVGPVTRAALNSIGDVAVVAPKPGTPVAGAALTVAAATQPANSLAPQSASRVPFTKVTLTAGSSDVGVNSITVERSGLGEDAVFAGIVLLDENGIQIGIAKTLNSNHQAVIGEPFTVKAGTTRTLTVAGNMASSLSTRAGQVVGLNVVSVNTSGTVSGSLPVMGAMHTINASLTLGSATGILSSFDPNSAQSKEIGTTNYKFTGVRVTAGSTEKVRMWSVRFNQSGSASSNDLANIKVNVDGTDYATVLSADGKYYTATFGSGVVIDKGFSKDIYIHGDVVGSGAAGRTVQFDLYKNTDLYMTGETYGYGIILMPSGNTASSATTASQFLTSDGNAITSSSSNTASTPFLDASRVTISAGSVTSIAKANTVPAQNIAKNVNNQVLGGFMTDIKGEPISVQSLTFTVSTSSATAAPLTQVTIVDENGSVVAGPIDQSLSTTALTFTDTVTFPVGQKVYTLKGKISSLFENNQTVTITATPASWTNITGQVTGNSISFSSLSSVPMNQMTVKAGAMTISVSPSPAAQTIVAGTVGRVFANYQFDATQSGEDLRFSSLTLTLGGTGTASKLTACQLFDGNTAINTGSNVVTQAAATNAISFDQSLVIAKGTTKNLALKCNIDSSASGTYVWGVTTSSSNPTITGSQSSGSITATGGTLTGQTLTIGSAGSLVASIYSNPTYRVGIAGTTGNEIGQINFQGTNEDIQITKIGLSLTGSVSALASNGAHVGVYDGNTLVGTVNFTTGASVASTTLTTPVVVTKGGSKALTIKADLAEIGSGMTEGIAGKLVSVDYNSAQGTGVDSGTTIEASGSTSFAGVRLQKTVPTITYAASSGALQSGANTGMFTVTVAADPKGGVLMNKLTFALATTTAATTGITFTGDNGAVGSTSPIVNSAGTLVTVYFDSNTNTEDRKVPAGTTKTYRFNASSVVLSGGSSGTTGSVSITLKADSAYPTLSGSYLMASTTVSGLAGQNTLWSPVSTTSLAAATTTLDDWTNGYGLKGAFINGLGSDGYTVSKSN